MGAWNTGTSRRWRTGTHLRGLWTKASSRDSRNRFQCTPSARDLCMRSSRAVTAWVSSDVEADRTDDANDATEVACLTSRYGGHVVTRLAPSQQSRPAREQVTYEATVLAAPRPRSPKVRCEKPMGDDGEPKPAPVPLPRVASRRAELGRPLTAARSGDRPGRVPGVLARPPAAGITGDRGASVASGSTTM